MNTCPYSHDSAVCSLLASEASGSMVYCQQCSQFAFRCADGHWNRAFARYCTQCSQQMEKPAQWDMASGNPQRTATLPQKSSHHNEFGAWVANIPQIETGDSLPGLLAIDGLIAVPNPGEKKLDTYKIVYDSDRKILSLNWNIPFSEKLTYGSTPIYHGLHLYTVVSGGIQKTSVIDGKTDLINNINGVDADKIKPLPQCAPMKCKINGREAMVAGVKQGMLLFDLAKHNGLIISGNFFDEKNESMSPTLCGQYIVFTSKRGGIFSLNIGTNSFKKRDLSYENRSFSAPVSVNSTVYFEAIGNNGHRSLKRFDPNSGKLTKAMDLDHVREHNIENRLSLFAHPPLTDGKQLFLSDISGQVVYTYDTERGVSLPNKNVPKNGNQHLFAPHQSIVVNNRIYSAHSYGLTILGFGQNSADLHQPLAMGQPENPKPVARPIRYENKLFILCKDRLICRDY
ncbi:MAG: hypothetical protein OXI67_13100 [Candidatus Poribacteria bacterium]|nr:hypothetical protein [Candidatus Poribacteria bacterium]